MSHVLLLAHAAREARFVQATLARTGWTDVLLWHETTLGRGLALLGLCEFRLILLGASLLEQPLDEALRAIGHSAPGVPVVVMRLPDVRAVVDQPEMAEMLCALHSILGH